jgi:hypothetical protein
MTGAWIAVIGTLGGVVGTGVIGLATAGLTHHWSSDEREAERKHVREETERAERLSTYLGFLSAADAWHSAVTATTLDTEWWRLHEADERRERFVAIRQEHSELWDAYDASKRRIDLIAGPEVRQHADDWGELILKEISIRAGTTGVPSITPKQADLRRSTERKLVEAMRAELKR